MMRMVTTTMSRIRFPRWPRTLSFVAAWLLVAPWLLWSFGAIWFDFPVSGWAATVAIVYACVITVLAIGFRGNLLALASTSSLAALITIGWLQLPPLQYRDWKPEVAVLPRAEIHGDEVTIHNYRNFEYRTVTDFDIRYESRTFRLSKLQGVDLFLNYWGSPMMAHPILSFDFGSDGRVCFSIETRPEREESYSALRGLYRGFELICIAADERDVIQLRSNIRRGEDTYRYRLLAASPEKAFREYIRMINRLHKEPHWYNAVTNNCTTSLRAQRRPNDRAQWDWRMLVNGYLDELLYERGLIEGSLPFEELKANAWINSRAMDTTSMEDFSARIRREPSARQHRKHG